VSPPADIAYLILAHHQPSHLAHLVQALDGPGARVFIHVDRKADMAPFARAVPTHARVHFLSGPARVAVSWGGYSVVQATLNLLRAAVAAQARCARYCLLSGADFPIKPAAHIREALGTDTEFLRVDRRLSPAWGDRHTRRARYLHLYDHRLFNPRRSPFPRLRRGAEVILRCLPRRARPGLPLYQGAQWWALTDACVTHILAFVDAHRDYVAFHRFTGVPDETFFHSIVKRSPFAGRISHDLEGAAPPRESLAANEHGCHYIDWDTPDRGEPRVLDLSDAPALLRSRALFARKFAEGRSDALRLRLEEHIRAPGLTRG
jgi:hypothetical protein